MLLLTVVFTLTSIVALCASLALSHGVWRVESALWFVYEVSRYFAYIGISISAGMIVTVAIRHTVSKKFLVLMEFSIFSALLFVWCAAYVFRSPW